MGLQRSRTSFEPRLKPSTTFPSSLYGPIGLSCRVSGMRTAATVAAPIAARKFGAPSWLLPWRRQKLEVLRLTRG